jgi:hypothetical protein
MRIFQKINRTPEEVAQLRAIREKYQKEKLTPLQLLTEGGHENFLTLEEVLELHKKDKHA